MGFNLMNPDFGNSYKTDCVSVHKQSVGGDLILYKAAEWPDIKSFSVVFSYFDQIERDAFLKFFIQSQGIELTYIDHENITWKGFITSETIDFIQLDGSRYVDPMNANNNKLCSFSTGFTFEGRTIP